jgi:peptide/nickel transport system permease protein
MALIVVVAVGAGLVAGSRPGARRDAAVSIASLSLLSVPEFVLAGLLITVFAFGLGWLPAVSVGGDPLDRLDALVLPVATLVLVAGAYATRLVRAVVAEASRAPHVEAARLAGVPEWRVVRRHLMPGTVGPIAQVLALIVPYLVGGAVVVERIFNYPGLGALIADAVSARDAVLVEGAGLVLAATTVAALVIADVAGLATNPKLRTAPR